MENLSQLIKHHFDNIEKQTFCSWILSVIAVALSFISPYFLLILLIPIIMRVRLLYAQIHLESVDPEREQWFRDAYFPVIRNRFPILEQKNSFKGIKAPYDFIVSKDKVTLIMTPYKYWIYTKGSIIEGPLQDMQVVTHTKETWTTFPRDHHETLSFTWLNAKRTNPQEPDLRYKHNHKIFHVRYYEVSIKFAGHSWISHKTGNSGAIYLQNHLKLPLNPEGSTKGKVHTTNHEYFSKPARKRI
jgi:hypothetical protein